MVTIGPVSPVGAAAPAAPLADPRQQDFQRALAGQLGKTMRADVVSRLDDGSYIVKVADTTARMMLPTSTQPGTPVSLRLVAITPRPTFQLETETAGGGKSVVFAEADASFELPGQVRRGAPDSAANVHIAASTMAQARADADAALAAGTNGQPGPSNNAAAAENAAAAALARPRSLGELLLSRAPLTPAAQLPTLDAKTAPAQLSEGARMIADVLATAARHPAPQTAVVAPLPLLDPAVPPDARHIAHMLKEAFGRSGLFYESHLHEWNAGTRGIDDIRREPQMERAAQGQAPRNPATDPASADFVNLQLTTQEHGRAMWMGQLLPGQHVAWNIERDESDTKGEPGKEAEPAWRSGLTLRFAGLGEITAQLVLSGGNVHVSLNAPSTDTAELLRRHAPALGTSLDAAGSPLASFAVRDEAGDG